MKKESEANWVDAVVDPASPWKLPRLDWGFPKYRYRMSVGEWKSLLAKASEGNAQAEYLVALYYDDRCKDRHGRIFVRCSARKAVEWLRRAAEHGVADAQCHFGVLLSNGTGMKKDPHEGLLWMKRAFRGGNKSTAPNNIAVTYREIGQLHQAVRWFRKAAALGDDGVFVDLGVHQYWSKGVRADHAAAVRCFRKAIRGKNVVECQRDDAFFYLAIAYLEGKGVRKSLAKARKYLDRANQDNDHPAAQRLLKKLTRLR